MENNKLQHLSVCQQQVGSNKLVKKNLFNIDLNKSSDVYGSQSLKACNPCAAECEKINKKINNRKLSDIKDEEVAHILSPFNTYFSF